LAELLLSSLDGLSEAEVEQLWAVESRQRAMELDQGRVQPVSAEELRQRVRALLA
jgi:hypothetical protein